MALNKIDLLNKISKQIPDVNQKLLQQQQAAQEIQLMDQALDSGADETQIGKLGVVNAQQQGKLQLESQQQTNQQLAQIDEAKTATFGEQMNTDLKQQSQQQQLDLNQYKMDKEREVFNKGMIIDHDTFNRGMEFEKDTAELEIAIGSQILSERKEFKQGQMGKYITNARQLADWKIATAKDQLEMKSFIKDIGRTKDKALRLQQLLANELKHRTHLEYQAKEAKARNEMEIKLKKQAIEAEQSIRKKKNENMAWINGAIGVVSIVAGVVLLPYTGGATSALIVYGAGSLGSAAGSAAEAS
jgi:hypothetical protein